MKQQIKVLYCVAYDWYLLKHSIPTIYEEADVICVSLDENLTSWTGNRFDFDEAGFFSLIRELDKDNKIKIYRDNFYVPELGPMQNEVRQRNLMSQFLGINDHSWYVQLDADEYFIDFKGFTGKLRSIHSSRPVNVASIFITLFKQFEDGYLWIKNDDYTRQEIIPLATNKPDYEFGRRNGYFNIFTNYAVLHQSWARSEQEIQQKIENWGHNRDFDVQAYFNFWKSISTENYKQISNFHPISPENWNQLVYEQSRDIEHLIRTLKNKSLVGFPPSYLIFKNSIWISRLKKVLSMLKK
jgi:hypothetical protein